MAIAVYNISATSARVTWPPSPGCLDTFYSVMYSPNWNSLLMAFKRKSFMHEERIPVSQTATHLANLFPQTTYLLCVSCQAANPTRDQCQVFTTLIDNGEGQDRAGWELAAGAWLTCCVLLLVIAAVLLWGCRRSVRAGQGGRSVVTDAVPSGRLYSPRGSCDNGGRRELRTLARMSGSEPA
ncbi:fibronectin type III domain-containing protein 9 [Corythoichthys intestinalis]|uniref:fibronectin type III domain-containing protein 9 n=1 Tax=Corythoichthys intestinalis TaxID=161448 RepID=UPI0025A55C1E|nr:fibronectin type III domain-containing protein 9 [Corythoichthys intestinalis]XP_057696344.1 fibronectin type III domain-containing protein 9 [Corythoichthys intestinalis]XP_061790221.1 fibronectin type III domain-containing protein 9-like [Nerophis lumbriciformis]